MDPTIIFLIIFLIVATSVYFGYTKWWQPRQCVGKKATKSVSIFKWKDGKCVANVCTSDFTGDDCSTVDTSCSANCSDTKCTGKKCTKCNPGYGTKLIGTPASDGTCPSYYKEYDGIDYRGPDISHKPIKDKDDCISQCSGKCLLAVTDNPVTTCWLKSEIGSDDPYKDSTRITLAPVSFKVPPPPYSS